MTSLRPGSYNLQIKATNPRANAAGNSVCTTPEESVSGYCETAVKVNIKPFLNEMPNDPTKLEINWQLPDIVSVDRPAHLRSGTARAMTASPTQPQPSSMLLPVVLQVNLPSKASNQAASTRSLSEHSASKR
jgi:hypothetical protein